MPAEKTDVKSDTSLRFNEDIEILVEHVRPGLTREGFKVYSARGEGRAPSNMVAYICDGHVTPRLLKSPNMAAISNPHMPRLVASGAVMFPQEKRRRYCFIYEDTFGSALLHPQETLAYGIKPEVLANGLIKPMVGVLYDLLNSELMHGAIRPQNLFGSFTDRGVEKFMLGECLSLPPGYDQPVLYETIVRAMTNPPAKFDGTIKDDLYSFGVTLAVLMRTHDPMAGFGDQEIIQHKQEHSSFTALYGKESSNGTHVDLLRGLLQDDPGLRWTVQDIEGWLEGRRQTPKTGLRKRKAGRPITVNTDKYIYPELLANDVYKNPSELARLIDNGEVEQWITRSLDDKETENRFVRLKSYIEDGGPRETRDRRMLTSMSIALHPEAPLRYESLSIIPHGFGTAFSETVMKKGNIRPYLDIINMRCVVHWLEVQEVGGIDISGVFSRFDACRNYLSQAPSGFGFERVLYEMDAGCACLSEKIASYEARTPEDILFAFDEINKSSSKPVRLFDRHVMAFLMARDRKNIEPYMHDLNGATEQKKVLGELLTLATIQKRTRSAPVPHLSEWFANQADIFLSRIHDRDERRKLAASFKDTASSGDLTKLVALIDNPNMKMADAANFRKALAEYHALENEALDLKHQLASNPNFGKGAGRTAAAGISALIAFILIMLTMFVYMSGGTTDHYF